MDEPRNSAAPEESPPGKDDSGNASPRGEPTTDEAADSPTSPQTRFEIFICYCRANDDEKNALLKHLRLLSHSQAVVIWNDERIEWGEEWEKKINEALGRANAAILLISADFLNSDFIIKKEVPKILARHEARQLSVLPIIAKPCAWETVKWLSTLEVRPRGGTPVWPDNVASPDAALANLAREVDRIINGPAREDEGEDKGPGGGPVKWLTRFKRWVKNKKWWLLVAGLLLAVPLALGAYYYRDRLRRTTTTTTTTTEPPAEPQPYTDDWHLDYDNAGKEVRLTNWDAPGAWNPKPEVEKVRGLLVAGEEVGVIKILDSDKALYDCTVDLEIVVLEGQTSASWVLRAADKQNYYLFTLQFPVKDGARGFIVGHLYEKDKQPRELQRTGTHPLPYNSFNAGDIISLKIKARRAKLTHVISLTSIEATKNEIDPSKVDPNRKKDFTVEFTDQADRYLKYGAFGFKTPGPAGRLLIQQLDIKSLDASQ